MTKLRQQFTYGIRPGTTNLTGYFTIPSNTNSLTHEVTIGDFKGVKKVHRKATGRYLVQLDEPYLGLTGFVGSVEGTVADGYFIKLYDKSCVDGYTWDGTRHVHGVTAHYDGYIQVLCVDDQSAAKDPIGHNIWLSLNLKTSEQG